MLPCFIDRFYISVYLLAQKPISVIDLPACSSPFQAKPLRERILPDWVADAPQMLLSVPVMLMLVAQITVLVPLLVTVTLAQYPEFQSLVVFTTAVTLLLVLDTELATLDATLDTIEDDLLDATELAIELITELATELLLELAIELTTELVTDELAVDEVIPQADTTPKGAGCVLQVLRAIQLF